MARARNIPVGELSGSVGGLTFSKNRSGGLIKAKSNPVNRNTINQSSNRNRFSSTNSTWHSLTDSQKNEWNTLASKDNLSGLNLFISCNKNLMQMKTVLIDTPVTSYRPNNSILSGRFIKSPILLRSPYFNMGDFSFNRGLQVAKSVITPNITATGTILYFILSFIPTNLWNVLGLSNIVYSDLMENSSNLKQTLIIYFREIKAQNSESRNNSDFKPLLSWKFFGGTSNINSPFISFYFGGTGFLIRSVFARKLRLGSTYELSYRIINQMGFMLELNRVFYTFV